MFWYTLIKESELEKQRMQIDSLQWLYEMEQKENIMHRSNTVRTVEIKTK